MSVVPTLAPAPTSAPMPIAAIDATEANLAMLAGILIDVVADGGSVSFMHPLAPEAARSFWTGALAAAADGRRTVLGAWDGAVLAGTVTLLLDCPPNQPHRGEIAKLMVSPRYRGRGLALALMREAEHLALLHARTLLVLDTASEGGAAGFYEQLGYRLAGEIPGYALKPHGGLTGTKLYWKNLGADVE